MDRQELHERYDVAGWAREHGNVLYRYALMRLRDGEVAAELVQETFLTGLRSLETFSGRSSLQTWLIGILKNLILRHFHQRKREAPVIDADEDGIDRFFNERVHWADPGVRWSGDPERVALDGEFRRILRECLDRLPVCMADCFVLKEIQGLESEEICKELKLTLTNFWVQMHRARIRLRECLQFNWFGKEKR